MQLSINFVHVWPGSCAVAVELDGKVPVHHGLHTDHLDDHGQVGGWDSKHHNVGLLFGPV